MTVPVELADAVALVRREVSDLHAELPRNGLVAWTAGNVSARIRGAELFVIKPSGVFYDELTPDNMVVCDLGGNLVEGNQSPSSDTAAHALCTGTCRRSTAWYTPTLRTPPPGPTVANRSRACGP